MDNEACVLVRVFARLSGDRVFLAAHRLTRVDVAVLEDSCCVSEDEVDGAVDIAVSQELTARVKVESVLIAFERTFVEDGEV